jgi:hypothetical protein
MRSRRTTRSLAVALVALAGCGSDQPGAAATTPAPVKKVNRFDAGRWP